MRKRGFLRLFLLKLIVLPRQARDKHRESTQKKREARFCRREDVVALRCDVVACDPPMADAPLRNAEARKNAPFLASILHKNDRFTKTGSGQT